MEKPAMPKNKPTPASNGPANGPTVAVEPMDPNKFAATLPMKRIVVTARLEEIIKSERELAQAKAEAMAQANELAGQAAAVAAILGKTVQQVLGISAEPEKPTPL